MRGPSRRRSEYGAAFRATARSRTAPCSAAVRSSSARKWRVVIGRPRGSGASWRRRGAPGGRRRRGRARRSLTTSGGARRIAFGATGLTMKPASRAWATTAADQSPARTIARSRPAPRVPTTRSSPSAATRGDEVLAGLAGVVEQALGGDGVEDGQPGRTGQRVPAERRAVHARREHPADVGSEGDEGADGHAAAEALGEGDGVGDDTRLLEGEPRPGAADAGLDLVEDEQGACLVGDLAGRLQVAGGGGEHAALPLHRLEDDGAGLVGDGGAQGVDVAPRDVADAGEQRLERLAVGLLVGERQRSGAAPVEGALGRDDPGAAGAAGELDGRLDRLGPAVAEEDRAALRRAGDGEEPLGELDLRDGGEEVRHVDELPGLLGDRRDEGGVVVAEGVDGDAADEVEVAAGRRRPTPRRRHRARGRAPGARRG